LSLLYSLILKSNSATVGRTLIFKYMMKAVNKLSRLLSECSALCGLRPIFQTKTERFARKHTPGMAFFAHRSLRASSPMLSSVCSFTTAIARRFCGYVIEINLGRINLLVSVFPERQMSLIYYTVLAL